MTSGRSRASRAAERTRESSSSSRASASVSSTTTCNSGSSETETRPTAARVAWPPNADISSASSALVGKWKVRAPMEICASWQIRTSEVRS